MREVTPQSFDTFLGNVISEKETLAQLKHEAFRGVSRHDVLAQLDEKFGNDWILTKNKIKLTQDDINAAGNNRYFKAQGMTLLLGWAIAILCLAMFTTTIPLIPVWLYYIANTIAAFGFVYVFFKGQRKARRELWRSIHGDSVETGK